VMLVGLLAGCSASSGPSKHPREEGQSYHDAIEMMCHVDRLAGLSVDDDPIQIGAHRAEWIAEHIEHPDAIEFRTLITVRPPGEQARLLKQQAKSVGLEDCPLADSWEAEAVHGEASRTPPFHPILCGIVVAQPGPRGILVVHAEPCSQPTQDG